MKYIITLFLALLLGCEEKSQQNTKPSSTTPQASLRPVPEAPPPTPGGTNEVPIDVLDSPTAGSDLPPVSQVDFTRECEGDEDPADAEMFCRCNPQCCEQQQWWCPPRPDNQIHRTFVTVTICDDTMQPCDFGIDEGCPPPQIIRRGECELAFECPPNTETSEAQWFDCELGDGRFGKQKVACNKGRLIYSPCQPCEEEQCDGEDQDCDNRIDEGRFRCDNECGTFGSVSYTHLTLPTILRV